MSASEQNPDPPAQRSPFTRWILRKQGWLMAPLAVGVLLSMIGYWRVGAPVIGSAFVLAGLVPVISGVYASPLYRLRGWAARLRGLVTVGLGLFVGALPWLLPPT